MGTVCGCVQEEEKNNEVVVGVSSFAYIPNYFVYQQPGKMLKTADS
jgi:hypothetical protein